MTARPTFDLAAIYRESRLRLLALAPTLSDEQLATVTPTCPDWTVKDIYGHLTGLAAEVVDGRIENRGAPDRTAVQVASRRDRTIEEVCAEWGGLGDAIEAVIEDGGRVLTPLAIDVWTHEQDLANAAGVESGRDGAGLFLAMNSAWALKSKLRDEGIAPLRVLSGPIDWVIGDGEPGATLALPEYEMARAFMARRSIAQLRAYDWDGDAGPYLEHIPFFEPPQADIVE